MTTHSQSFAGATIAVALVAAGALIFDAMTPRVVSSGVFYVGMVLIGFWFPQPKAALGLALLATPLIILGYWISIPEGMPAWVAWMNRGIALGSTWLTAVFVWNTRVLEQKLQLQIDVAGSLSREIKWLASVVMSSDDAIISSSLDGSITSWNKGAERLFGYFAEEAIGEPVSILIPPVRQDEENACPAW
jgi:PAS domain-containing protein